MERETPMKPIAFLLVAIAAAGSLVVSKAPDRASYRSYATFSDPDGNGWLWQEVTIRLPGRIDHNQTAYASENELVSVLQPAAAVHGKREKRIEQKDLSRPAWYTEYVVSEQTCKKLPE